LSIATKKAGCLTQSTSTVIARHDYLPFGEEIGANVGRRTMAQGYNVPDSNRQKYAMLERDSTGLDHTWWRKYESTAGRWTSPDPMGGSIGDPQSFNAYSYSANDPVHFVDPSGLRQCMPGDYSADCDASGFGGWGGGFNMNNHISLLGNSGWQTILEAQYEHDLRYDPENGPFRFHPIFDPQNPFTSGQVQTLRDDIEKLLKGRDDCAKFVQSLLNTVAANTQVPFYNADPLKVFDAVAGMNGGGLFLSPGQGASGYSYGSINGRDAKITFDISFGGFSFVRGLTGLHEITHEATGVAGRLYLDQELASAAYTVALQQGYKNVPEPPNTKDVAQNSKYYDERLFKACSPNQHK